MASRTLDVGAFYPDGTTLNAYSFGPYADNPDGTLPPAVTATATVTLGFVTFSGLAASTLYYTGTGSPPYTYIAFSTPAAASSGGTTGTTVESYIDGTVTRHVPHRGVGRMQMENSQEGLALANSLGATLVDGGDFQISSDGLLVSSHEDPIIAGAVSGPGTAAFSGAINTITGAQWKAMTLRPANYAYKPSFTNILGGTPLLGRDYGTFMAAHPNMIWCPELKVAGVGGAELLSIIQANGLERRTIATSFNLNDLAIFKAAGVRIGWIRTTTSGYSLALAQAAGVDFFSYSFADATFIAAPGLAAIQAAYDAGIKLAPFTFVRRSQITDEAARVGRPLAMVYSDYGIYTGNVVGVRLTDRYNDGLPFPGQVPSAANPGNFTRSTAGKFSITGAARVLQGWACTEVTDWAASTSYAVNAIVQQDTGLWVCNTAHTSGATFAADSAKWTVYKLTFTTTFETVGAAGSTGIVVACGCASDRDITSGTTIQDSGILLTIKKDGTSVFSRWTSGTARQTTTGPANNSGGAVARVDGAVEQWTVEFLTGVNAGKVKVSNVTATTSATQTDNATGGATPRRGYITFGTTAADLDVSFSGVALT